MPQPVSGSASACFRAAVESPAMWIVRSRRGAAEAVPVATGYGQRRGESRAGGSGRVR